MSKKLKDLILVILLFVSISLGQIITVGKTSFKGKPILDENGNATGLFNMNPDLHGDLWIAGGLKPMTEKEISEYNSLPKFEIPENLKGRQLPPTCDNSIAPEFRGIFNQIGGSCGQASGMGYHFSYERNLVLGAVPDNNTGENICAYGFAWNFVNGGSGSGSWPNAGYNIAEAVGCGHTIDFNGQDNGGSGTAWMDGYEGYYNGNDCHIIEQVSFDKSDIEKLKNWFYDKGTGTGENGGCVTFGSSVSFSISTISSGPYQGQKLCTSLPNGSAHAMTLAGYSDEISFDLNGDGKITNDIDINRDGQVDIMDREEGAWQLVNSWGDDWNNRGKVWMTYSGFGGQKVVGIKVTPFETKLMIKATVTHSSRNNISLTTGFSEDINASSPSKTKSYSRAFNKSGGGHPMQGSGASATIEIGLDVTEFYTEGMAQGKFFLIANSSSGTVNKMSLMDYSSGTPVEIPCDQSEVSISGETYLSVAHTFSPLTTMVPNGGEVWERERTFDIKWASAINGDVKIELLKGEDVIKVIADKVTASEGSYTWEIEDDMELGKEYKILITSLEDETITDESNDVFSIEKKSKLTFESPNNGKTVEKGNTVKIKWEDNFDDNVNIALYRTGEFYRFIAEDSESDGEHSWDVPDDVAVGPDFKIRVSHVKKDWLFAESKKVFGIQNPVLSEYPYIENFDEFDTGSVALAGYWEQLDDDDENWTVWTGKTPSKIDDPPDETGPSGDHTSGNGKYLYTEASFGNNDKKMNIISPVFDFSQAGTAELYFWYHLFDKNEEEMGTLYMDIYANDKWDENVVEISGNQGDEWHEKKVDLAPYIGSKYLQVRFRGHTGSGWHSDIAIDDFKIDILTTGINDQNSNNPVSDFSRFAVAPNPVPAACDDAKFNFDKSAESAVLTVYDPLGGRLYEAEWEKGDELPVWDITNKSGRKVGSGTYLAVLWLDYGDGVFEQLKTNVCIKE